MTEPLMNGPMAMVKIDGAKIKRLREHQGLTQLYLATAVQVTTDTISRWENKRYPTIKKENGLKLAETLNVALEEILLLDETQEQPEEVPVLEQSMDEQASEVAQPSTRSQRKKWPILVLSVTFLLVAAILGWLALQSAAPNKLETTRILPEHCISGQPFPVLIKLSGLKEESVALIIKEQPPAGAKILATSPDASAVSKESSEIKWLGKVDQDSVFAYILTITGHPGQQASFMGYAALNKNSDDMPRISGSSTISFSKYHWADTDRDNTISDKEILAVYDKFSEFKELESELDTIEEIWLGTGYKWNEADANFEILD